VTAAELILYATPSGPLADALDEIFRRIAVGGPTIAQQYPPHCTLTGFFHRDPADIPRIAADVGHAVAAVGERVGGVEIVGLHRRPDWVGLELESAWLRELTTRVVDRHTVGPDDDALRPKDWLHLSIGYGVDDLGPAFDATADLDLTLAAGWEVGLWQRHTDGSWSRLHC
jgi:ubiquitin-associated SH3 domain-containing protein